MKRAAVTYTRDDKLGPYQDAVRAAGIDPVLYRTGFAPQDLSGVEGLVLTGGTDVNPRRYNQEPRAETSNPDLARDEMEFRFLQEALERDLPVLAICRGMQLLNVVCGGTLLQHIDGHESRATEAGIAVHVTVLNPGSKLAEIFGRPDIDVNSRHHQAVDRPGAELIITARSKNDAIAEGVEMPQKRFVLGVQWHPEDQLRRYPEQKRLFDAFAGVL